MDLREPQHTRGAYPRHPRSPKWKELLHKLLVGIWGMFQGYVGKFLEWNIVMGFGSDHFPFFSWVICRFQTFIFQGVCTTFITRAPPPPTGHLSCPPPHNTWVTAFWDVKGPGLDAWMHKKRGGWAHTPKKTGFKDSRKSYNPYLTPYLTLKKKPPQQQNQGSIL